MKERVKKIQRFLGRKQKWIAKQPRQRGPWRKGAMFPLHSHPGLRPKFDHHTGGAGVQRVAWGLEKLLEAFPLRMKFLSYYEAHTAYLSHDDEIIKQLFLKAWHKMFWSLSFLITEQVSTEYAWQGSHGGSQECASRVSALRSLQLNWEGEAPRETIERTMWYQQALWDHKYS